MSTRSFGITIRLCACTTFFLFHCAVLRADTNPPPITPAELPPGQVRVQIIERIPDQTSWDFTAPASSETYFEPAFGFAVVPTKYSARGVKVDRGYPFLFRAAANIKLPQGEHRLLLRARTGSRLYVDGRLVLATRFPNLTADGHEDVPEIPVAAAPDIRYLRPGHFESITNFVADGRSHVFVLEALIGTKGRRPEPGELSVSIALNEEQTFRLLSPSAKISLTEDGWNAYESERRAHWKTEDAKRRASASADEAKYWAMRHELARVLHAPRVTPHASRPTPPNPSTASSTPDSPLRMFRPRRTRTTMRFSGARHSTPLEQFRHPGRLNSSSKTSPRPVARMPSTDCSSTPAGPTIG